MTCALICGYRCLSANEESCLTNDDEESELICKKKFYIDPPIIFFCMHLKFLGFSED